MTLSELNRCDADAFVRVCGPLFEHSPWVARGACSRRPFDTLDALHAALCETMRSASADRQLQLISAHPDLVGQMARNGNVTPESATEQAAAGLTRLNDHEIALFDRYNAAYRQKFGFPFVICARENRKDAILAAFPLRLNNSREQEMEAALAEIAKIAWLRILDAVSDS